MKLLIGNKNYSSWSLRPWLLLSHLAGGLRRAVPPKLAPLPRIRVLAYHPKATGMWPLGGTHMRRTSVFLSFLVIAVAACGSSGGGGTDGGAGSSGSGGSSGSAGKGGAAGGAAAGSTGQSGAELFSCTVTASSLCTQLLIPSTGSTLSTEQQTGTTTESGTSGMGCASAGVVGCCLPKTSGPSKEEECYYSAATAAIGQGICTSPHTWSTAM